MKKLSILLSTAVIFLAACNDEKSTVSASSSDTAKFDLAAVKASINESNTVFSNAIMKGDSTAIAACYAADAKAFPPHMPIMPDAKSIAAMAAGFAKAHIQKFSLEATDVYGDACLVAEEGKWMVSDSTGKPWDNGKYIVLWKSENGKWKMYRDIWNSDMPEAKK